MLLVVEFPHTEAVWNKVVVESTEDIYVDSEDTDAFTVEYRTTTQWFPLFSALTA